MLARRFSIRGVLVLAAAVMLAACSSVSPSAAPASEASGSDAPAESPTPAAPQVLVYANVTTFPDLDPSTGFSNDSAVVSNVYETLTRYAPPGSDPQIQPLLATEWSPSADGLTWTFKLRSGATFHDGTPVDAAAVKFSIERTKELAQGGAFIWDPVETITAVDDLTVEFKLKYEAPMDIVASSGYAAYIMSPTAVTGKDGSWFNEGNEAGSGPYTIETYEKDQRVVLRRFDDYWGGWRPGQFDTVLMKVVEDGTVRQQMIESGDADYTYTIPTENLPSLAANPDVRIVTNPAFQNLMILLNTVKDPTRDVLVRRALVASFPYDTIIDATMSGYASRARGAVPADMVDGSDAIQPPKYDLELAKSLLAQAGYPDGGLKLTMTFTAGDTVEQQAGELWRAELAKIGVDLEVRSMAWEAQWALAQGEPTAAQDGFMFYWWPTYVTPYDFMFNLFHTEDAPFFNLGYYKNPTFDALIDEAATLLSSDRKRAMEMFLQANQILLDDAAAIFVFDQQNIHVVRSDLKGFVDNPAYPHVLFAYDVSR